MYPWPLTPLTAAEAYNHVPDGPNEVEVLARVSCARANIRFAKHVILELRCVSTGKRRKFSTGQFVLPLCQPTNDRDLLDNRFELGSKIASRVNKWIAKDWANHLGCEEVLMRSDHPSAYEGNTLKEETKLWMSIFCIEAYFVLADRIAFKRGVDAFYFRNMFSGRTQAY